MILDPTLTIVAATDAYFEATMTTRAGIVGRNVFEVFPDNPDEPDATGVANLTASLDRVRRHRVPDAMAVQKYDVVRPAAAGGGFEVRYWSVRNSPALGPNRELLYIINQAEDVTDFVQMQQRGATAERVTAELHRRTEQMQAEILRRSAELNEANQALRAASDAKDGFLSRVSHELRTPLNVILGFSELLSLDELSAEHREWIGTVLKAGRHLLALLNDVLDISRVEGGHLSMSMEAVSVPELLAEVLDLARPLADAASVRLRPVPSLPDGLCVVADCQRLRQALLNLLSNAVKYNHPTGSVELSVERRDHGRLRINVTDTGRGVGPDAVTKLFTPFERLDAAQAGFEGTGLGLALSRHLVESMHGSLDFSSRPGQGSTFWIELPIGAPTTQVDAATVPDALVTRRGYRTGKRILYIDDMAENVRLVEQILAYRPAVTLIPAMLAGVGLDLAREHHPDLILLDLHLPDMPGEEVLRRLRADVGTRDIPVVMLSADATQHHIDRLLAAGATAYLTKPIAVRPLLQTIDGVLDAQAEAMSPAMTSPTR
jgi:signal transduction histidine kinase/ActR/RegA family two-component response regulator